MKNKIVYFGRIKTIQVECPKCFEWQFEVKKCDACGYNFSLEKEIKKDKTEYRSERPTWRNKIRESIRKKVFERDDFICQYCGIYCYEIWMNDKKSVTIDHANPFVSGGLNNLENLITCCQECNLLKSDKIFNSFEEIRSYIRKKKYGTLQTV